MNDNNCFEDLYNINFEDFLKSFILVKKEKHTVTSSSDLDNAKVINSNEHYEQNEFDEKHNSLLFLANDILNDNQSNVLFRRIYWPLLLGIYNSSNLDKLIEDIQKKRNSYKQDKEEYITKQTNLNIQKLDPQIFHPLSSDDKNPWTLKQKNQELNEEIKQDILRTYSEKKIFQNEVIRDILNKILFIWAKKNPSISYKQGMNEIVAIFFIVNYREQVYNDFLNFENKKYYKEYCTLFDKEEIESDTYIIFDHFMHMGLKYLFTSPEEKKIQSSKNSCKTVLLQKCTYIFHKLLKNSDKLLYNHLISLSIEPQIFLLRWIRLFYCREFQIDDTVILWDNFFSDCYLKNWENGFHFEFDGDIIEVAHRTSNVFPLVDYFAISMILFIRSFLLESDENYCLKRLFKYPPVENIRILIDLSFKLKSRSEKKEKNFKKDDSPVSNNINTVNMMNSNNFNVHMNTNINNSLSTFQIKNSIKNNVNNNTANEYIERNRYKSNVNIHPLNKESKNLSATTTVAHINNKLNKIIDNLNNLSFNLMSDNHRLELQQNVFHLNEILLELKNMEHGYEETKSEGTKINKRNEDFPIYFG
ncbi:GTPase-activating protein [Plasmodium brasilianum]|uniref:GTPase-activating protein, putative n=2 Tax=Plasmodium (Plasmodium) TaxID=418103 RepID=A0A1A8X0G0_PLAMA|nr:GTPase-activating protein, putative [Plasmodium malariae]KAI4836568.1 GTPase-activating protein [Plasmodium brasilianum]SBS97163.1 GTPase-activating protein, putative [Plasmodium malariae]SCO93841.1 GTPase-activating protein, putative [Plasmodium malariae]